LISCPCNAASGAQLAPHLPADPEQENAAGQQQPDDLQQLHRDAGESDPQHRGGDDADQDGLVALVLGQAGGCQSDDDRVVAGQHQIDHHDLEKCRQGCVGKNLGHAGGPSVLRPIRHRSSLELPEGPGAWTWCLGRGVLDVVFWDDKKSPC